MKKVKIYPIECDLIVEGRVLKVKVMMFNHRGCIIDTGTQIIKVQERVTLKANLPFMKTPIEINCSVVKNYDQFKGKHGITNPGSHMSEVLFREFKDRSQLVLNKFLGAITTVGTE